MNLADTHISVWQERDRLCIALTCDDRTLVEWIDDEAHEAIEDGFLNVREAILGNLERNAKQGGALHQSAFVYWNTRRNPQ